ncbi:hypothetical protein IWW39_000410 [Coemansia spiralis]|uniref:Uncharacterized protein n=1 Tax=Coemansia spiralis TaxID=417178 RepID=A0A9W8L750_9FUNG|nr:hypothetical protein IWW39_000410 [Coemansia spiralis]
MATLRPVYARRVNLLNCNQIHPCLPLTLSRANLSWPPAPAPAPATTKPAAGSTKENIDHDVLDIWRPLTPAPAPTSQLFWNRVGGPSSSDAAMLNVWMCPEIDSRQRRERARRRKAELLAERMTAIVQASDINKKRNTTEVEERRAKKRKAEEPPPVPLPSSPDLAKPQSLLIPALLPKGMLRSRPEAVVPESTETPDSGSVPMAFDLGTSPLGECSAMPFGLGLDLGFDIAQSSVGRDSVSGGLGVSSSIMEITSFLERDIDVFTPMSAARTPRSAVVPSMSSVLPTGGVKSPVPKQGELIEDILKLSF